MSAPVVDATAVVLPLQRPAPMSLRPLLVAATVALLHQALVTPAAYADQLNGGVVKMELRIPASDDNLTSFIAPDPVRLKRYFNSARCACGKSAPESQPYQVRYTWETEPTAQVSQPMEIWVGRGCKSADPQVTRDACEKLVAIADPDAIDTTVDREYDVGVLLSPKSQACDADEFNAEHWAVTETSDAVWDAENQKQLLVAADLKAPPVPTTLTVKARESGIALAWTALTDRADDIQYFQALCAKEDGSKAHTSPTDTARYQTVRTLCGASTDPSLPPATLKNEDIPPSTATLPTALLQLDGAFVCGEASGGTASSITLDDLDNDTAYWVVLLAVDFAGNVAGVHIDRPITPREVTDFWEEINNENGNVAGGFCVAQVGTSNGLGSLAVIGLAGLYAVRRRRRRASRAARAAAAVTVALVLAPAVASAQTYTPYFPDDGAESLGMPEVSWTLGLRLGPYVPSIDASFDSDPGPYERTFKFKSLMFAVDLHRVWSVARGQLGIGATVGYYTNSANSFEDGTTPSTPDRPRADDNITRLSILPTAITATYRATILDDEYGIPLVPYVRGGIAYDVWWIKNPADELSSAMSCATCDDRALGASIGLVGAVGLAVRAERIDPDAALSMRNSGLEHAGFFAELEYGWVNGFGNDTKLSLGDLTWFGGLSFEF